MSTYESETCASFSTWPYLNICAPSSSTVSLDCGGRWCTNIEAISSTCSSNELPPSLPTPVSPPSPSSNYFYCGTSWMNAKDSTCKPLSEGGGLTDTGTPCIDGNSTVCGAGSYCYADIICSQPTNPPMLSPPTTSQPTTPPTTSPPINPGALVASTTR